MTTYPTLRRRPAFIVAALLLVSAPALFAQIPTEGYDPMRQITAQLMKANLHILQDVTGSMAYWPQNSQSPDDGDNAQGKLAWSRVSKSGCLTTNTNKCRYWSYSLDFQAPSRMGILKNAMGSSVALVTAYTPPGVSAPWSMAAPSPNTAYEKTWVFTYDYGANNESSSVPAVPFTPSETITVAGAYTTSARTTAYTLANFPIVRNGACTIGSCTYYAPQDLIGKNKNRVNWGLTKFSTNGVSTLVYIDSSGANQDLARLEDYFLPADTYGLSTDPNTNTATRGLSAGGTTNTTTGLVEVKNAIQTTFAADPKKTCNRPYGVILVTDGQSNTNNGSDSPDAGTAGCSMGNSSWGSCPNNWQCYPAGIADDVYRSLNLSQDPNEVSPKVPVWVVGVSTDVGVCELDFTAYQGRTDANSPRGDAGFSGYAAANLPTDPGNPYIAEAAREDATTSGQHYDPSHGHNAYFATSASALAAALTAIVNATGTGDYATNAPVSGQAANLSNVIYLPSTGFPSWAGHIYAFDTLKQPTDPLYVKWDAGVVLNGRSADTRRIFTWDPTSTPPNALVEVTTANLGTLQSLGGAGVTAAVVDFIRGNDGTGTSTARSWRLGPMINSAPALVGAPSIWRQATTVSHRPFESQYASRTALLWVGSDDGMLHAFRITDGIEQIALVPPSLLTNQVQLYANYVNDTRNPKNPSGEPPDTDAHLYGVANSLRFGDVWFATPNTYKTVGVLTLGGGGNDVIAIDVTSVPNPDTSPYPTSPVSILWTKNSSTLTGLQQSWSMPAMAPVAADTFRLILGSGFRPANTRSAQTTNTNFVAPKTFTLDPTDGSLLQTNTLSSVNSPAPMVGDQAFADAVLFAPASKFYQEDNIAQLALQADLNGQIWFLYNSGNQNGFAATRVGIDATAKSGQSQPIYYSPAASGYASGLAGCVAYAFGSGTLYERSALVTGAGVGTTGFIPRVHVATASKASTTAAVPAANIVSKAIASPWCVANCDAVDPNARVPKTFGPKTQLTAPPFMLVPRTLKATGQNSITALFLLYDPDEGCSGHSYVARVEFIGSDTCVPTNVEYTAYDAGVGAASGFTIADTRVLVSKSGVGQGQRASIYEPPNIAASIGGTVTPKVKWWKELK